MKDEANQRVLKGSGRKKRGKLNMERRKGGTNDG